MRTLFAVPWLSSSGRSLLISLVTALLLVFGVFALLKMSGGGKHASPEVGIRRSNGSFLSYALCGAINAGDGADSNSTAQTAAE